MGMGVSSHDDASSRLEAFAKFAEKYGASPEEDAAEIKSTPQESLQTSPRTGSVILKRPAGCLAGNHGKRRAR